VTIARAIAITQIAIASPEFYPIIIHKGVQIMLRHTSKKNLLQAVLDRKILHTLVMELDEQKQESISGGGAKPKFVRNKPHFGY
jgi:NAD kinase